MQTHTHIISSCSDLYSGDAAIKGQRRIWWMVVWAVAWSPCTDKTALHSTITTYQMIHWPPCHSIQKAREGTYINQTLTQQNSYNNADWRGGSIQLVAGAATSIVTCQASYSSNEMLTSGRNERGGSSRFVVAIAYAGRARMYWIIMSVAKMAVWGCVSSPPKVENRVSDGPHCVVSSFITLLVHWRKGHYSEFRIHVQPWLEAQNYWAELFIKPVAARCVHVAGRQMLITEIITKYRALILAECSMNCTSPILNLTHTCMHTHHTIVMYIVPVINPAGYNLKLHAYRIWN